MHAKHILRLVAVGAAGAIAATPALAHGDHGVGGGIVLPAGITLVSIDYDYAKFNEIPDARLAALAVAGVEEVHSLKSISVPSLTLAYGMTRNFTVALRMPYLYNPDIRETDPDTPGVNDRGRVSGFGDVSLTGTYQVLEQEHDGFSAAMIFGVKAPTGSTSRIDMGGEIFETEHQPGSGSWDGILGASASRTFGELTLSANAVYRFSGTGARDTNVGDHFHYGIAASYRIWSSTTHDGSEASHLGAGFDGIMHHGGPPANGAPPVEPQTHHQADNAASLDVSLGLEGEHQQKVDQAGDINPNTGGDVFFITPGTRLTVGDWSGYLNVSLPIAQKLNGIQSDFDWRLATGVAVQF